MRAQCGTSKVIVSEAQRLPQDMATLERDVAERDALIASLRSTIAMFEGQVAALQSALVNHATEIELLKRRLFGPRSERGGTSELQLLLGDRPAFGAERAPRVSASHGTAFPATATPRTVGARACTTRRGTSRRR